MSDGDKDHKSDNDKDHKSDNDKDRKSDNDKDHKSDNDKDRKSDYDDKDHQSDYDDRESGECAVEHQKCCNSVDSVEEARDLGLFSFLPLTETITGNTHTNCSPYYSTTGGKSCTAQTVCCKNAKFYGLLAVGCTNFNL
ncbi:hypothetical protein EDB83DRAFT_2408421 [Lactarius deliciosus]|nr:hypothetical protein EDB83DRAFT_2408421 [Lactarius deliciosus]